MAATRDRRQKPRHHCRIGQPTAPERGTMRTLLLAAACVILFATAIVWRPDDGLAINCAAVRSASSLPATTGRPARRGFQACSNRCSIQSCQDTVIECRAGDQTVCNNGFRSCNNGCDALASIRLLPPSRIKRLAGAGAVHSSRSVSYSEPATCAPSPANRQSASICALSAPPLLLKSRGNGLKPNGLTLPST